MYSNKAKELLTSLNIGLNLNPEENQFLLETAERILKEKVENPEEFLGKELNYTFLVEQFLRFKLAAQELSLIGKKIKVNFFFEVRMKSLLAQLATSLYNMPPPKGLTEQSIREVLSENKWCCWEYIETCSLLKKNNSGYIFINSCIEDYFAFFADVLVLEKKEDPIFKNSMESSKKIQNLREKINFAILGKKIVKDAKTESAEEDSYLGWMSKHATGTRGITRFSHWFHGASGIERARRLLEIANDSTATYSEILDQLKSTFHQSSYHKHSLSRYLLAQFTETPQLVMGASDDKFRGMKISPVMLSCIK